MQPVVMIFMICGLSMADQPTRFPYDEYFGIGYNGVLGNPMYAGDDGGDPGFTLPVLQLTHNSNQMSTDNAYFVPDNIQVRHLDVCLSSVDSYEIMGMTSYLDVLQTDVSLEVTFPRIAFTASSQFSQITQSTVVDHSIYTLAVKRCVAYSGIIPDISAFHVTSEFAADVLSLPVGANTMGEQDQYINFISKWGTHYIPKIVFGAKTIVYSMFHYDMASELWEQGFNFSAGAEMSFNAARAGVSSWTSEQKQLINNFQSKTTAQIEWDIGVPYPYPSNGTMESWRSQIQQNPYPINYTLHSLTELFTPTFFPSASSSDLATKKDHLTNLYMFYCQGVQNCQEVKPDPTLPPRRLTSTTHYANSAPRYPPVFAVYALLLFLTVLARSERCPT